MLIKEYRIPLPLTVEEYRIAQLFMIAKKSRDESSGAGSGVEIIINEPYENGPGGNGQYTKKIYHIGSHLPGWVKGLLPKSALTVEEQAWNAYPYTKTRYTCPFVEKFSLEIETYYFADDGHQENVFGLSGGDLRNRVVDLIDVVKDQLYGADYVVAEDPKLFVSEKTQRGPLDEGWLSEYWNEVKGKKQPTAKNMSLMCAYKLCRVEFRYWGMQTKLEKFIHDIALRKTMLRAHRQAWAWQDEWHGLTMDDIREIERQTQLALQKKMGLEEDQDDDGAAELEKSKRAIQMSSIEKTEDTPMFPKKIQLPELIEHAPSVESSDDDDCNKSVISKIPIPSVVSDTQRKSERSESSSLSKSTFGSKGALHSPAGSTHSFDLQPAKQTKPVANWRMEKLEVDSKSGSEEEFFDCLDMTDSTSLAKWSSLELLPEEEDSPPPALNKNKDDSIFSHAYLQRVASERGSKRPTLGQTLSIERTYPESPPSSPGIPSCPTSVLILVFHAGSVLDANVDKTAKKSDVTTFRGTFESIMRQHYPSLIGHVIIKLVSCPPISADAIGIVSSLSPYSFESSSDTHKLIDLPLGAIPLLACSCSDNQEYVNKTIVSANMVYGEFLKSDDGRNFNGQIVLIGDSMGSVLAFDALCRGSSNGGNSNGGRHGSDGSALEDDNHFFGNELDASKLLTPPSPRRRSSSLSDPRLARFDFEVSDFFMFGSPLGYILAARRIIDNNSGNVKPHCSQIYNLFHPTDPISSRLEPLISARFSVLTPVNVPRYVKFPLGNGQPCHLLELIQTNPHMFQDGGGHHRRLSDSSMQSNVSGLIDSVPLSTITNLQQRWWGTKRLDYAFYCPEGLNTFSVQVLPHLFHASYWESTDVIAFVLRQLARFDTSHFIDHDDKEISFNPGQPREKWIKKRTSVKLKNVAANHRANDVIVREGEQQKLSGRFMYGPFDMITLAGEKVDIHIMKEPPAGEWFLVATEVTDKTGRIFYTIPDDKSLSFGIYPIKMVVRGDHTSVDFYLAVIPPRTECIVFSIDGSFTASMSVTGKDPKVRAGAVDVCRHWQELGYLLIYITGRPDMQQQRVLSWLSQHNFPHGLVSFADGISTDPLGHKTAYLNNLIQNHSVSIIAAYGSSKDIGVYTNIGLKAKQIYIVGKVPKKLQLNSTVLTDGYAAHLLTLNALGGCRPAQGNQRMVIPRGCFNLPGQTPSIRRRRLHEPDVN